MTQEYLTYQEIHDLIEAASLGTLSDGNTVEGNLLTFINGAFQALYNIAKNPPAVQHALKHLRDTDKDVWEEGHDTIIALYARSLSQV